MEAFVRHTGLVALLDHANVDTDQIIPKQFLKSIRRTGFGPSLFFDWRYLPDASDNPEFELNKPRYAGASILVTRNNFGCGSSREHAVWAVRQYGFRAVIAPWREQQGARIPGFADIFRNNAVKNGLLTVELSEAEVETIFRTVKSHKGCQATVDLEARKVTVHAPRVLEFAFEIDPGIRDYLLNGWDEISLTLREEEAISRFEAHHNPQRYS